MEDFRPRMSGERVEHLRRWHERASSELHSLGAHDVEYLGLQLHVPAGVFPPAPMSQLLGRAVLDTVRCGDVVLDMGTGCGVNAILAATRGAQVVAVDINPAAVDVTRANAVRNGVGDRVEAHVSDLFDEVEGIFDVVIFDPPFRWFTPRDMLERAFADEGYRTLDRFIGEVDSHLAAAGSVLMFFGTTGDIDYLRELSSDRRVEIEEIDSATFTRDGATETYWALRLRPHRPS